MPIYFGAAARSVARDDLLLFSLPAYSPNCLQGEVNRQSSTSSTPSFPRWVGDESRTDDRKKAAKSVAPQPSLSLSLSFFLSVAPLNVSFIQNHSKSLPDTVSIFVRKQVKGKKNKQKNKHSKWAPHHKKVACV